MLYYNLQNRLHNWSNNEHLFVGTDSIAQAEHSTIQYIHSLLDSSGSGSCKGSACYSLFPRLPLLLAAPPCLDLQLFQCYNILVNILFSIYWSAYCLLCSYHVVFLATIVLSFICRVLKHHFTREVLPNFLLTIVFFAHRCSSDLTFSTVCWTRTRSQVYIVFVHYSYIM